MGSVRWWAFWRRVQYGSGFLAVLLLIGSGVYFGYFYEPADCFDSVMNGNESGIDCGGKCVRICAAEVLPPRVVWTESFKIMPGQYNAVAYVENLNDVAGTPILNYTFELLDGERVIATRSGETVFPPNSIYPIFEGRIYTDATANVTETRLTLEMSELWLPAQLGREQFKTTNILLTGADARPRLEASVENIELTAAEDVEIVATLFNEAGEPVTASQTFIEKLEARSTQNVVFTWPSSIAKTVRSCIIPSDVVVGIDLSGSMNNDGGTPPEPVTSALKAATDFVNKFKANDQAAVVTFASGATTNVTLNSDHRTTATLVAGLTIAPSEETGYTNTVAALEAARKELASERHNGDARRVLVLLTDGLPTAKGDTTAIVEEAIRTASLLKEEGVDIYAIGLGKGVNLEFISSIASNQQSAFIAPSGKDLEAIYNTITSSLCESGATRIDVIAKTPTNFAPLR